MNNNNLSRIWSTSVSLAMALIALVGASALAAGLGNTEQFAVEMTMTADMGAAGSQSMVAKYYVGEDRIRMQATLQGMEDAGSNIAVFDGDEVTIYTLMPGMKQYTKQVGTFDDYMDEGPGMMFGSPDDADHPCQTEPDTTCEKIGSDTVMGRSTDKYYVKSVEDGVPTETEIWIDRELLFPLKFESDEGLVEATSLEFGTQPDALFEIPTGYTEMQTQW